MESYRKEIKIVLHDDYKVWCKQKDCHITTQVCNDYQHEKEYDCFWCSNFNIMIMQGNG